MANWRLHIRLNESTRRALSKLAYDVELLHVDDEGNIDADQPLDAEVLRVLLVSVVLPGVPVAARVARALACNLTIVLSTELSAAVAQLGTAIENLAVARLGEIAGPRVSLPPEKASRPASRTPAGVAPDRKQVLVTLDSWLRDQVERAYRAEENTTTAVREAIEKALINDRRAHYPVVVGYAERIGAVRRAVREAALTGREAVREAMAAVYAR